LDDFLKRLVRRVENLKDFLGNQTSKLRSYQFK
jgi:hypothetical protein